MTPAVRFLLVIGLTLAAVVLCGITWRSSVRGDECLLLTASAPPSPSPIVERRGWYSPSMTFDDPLDLPDEIIEGPEGLRRAFSQGIVAPLTLATADFDQDGRPDLLTGYATSAGGALILRTGSSPSMIPSGQQMSPSLSWTTAHGKAQLRTAPFSSARALPTAIVPAHMVVGDFDGDGHKDIVAADRRSPHLLFLGGDGRGQFPHRRWLTVDGTPRALAPVREPAALGSAGEHLIVATQAEGRARLILFKRLAPWATCDLALSKDDEVFLQTPDLDGDFVTDLTVVVGERIVLFDDPVRRGLTKPQVLLLDASARRIAVADFDGDRRTDIAALSADGRQVVIFWNAPAPTASDFFPLAPRRSTFSVAGSQEMIAASIDGDRSADLVLVNQQASSLTFLSQLTTEERRTPVREDFPLERRPLAVLVQRLNSDGLDDLVILTESGPATPTIPSTSPTASRSTIRLALSGQTNTLTVTTTSDSGEGSLRQALIEANASTGPDTIVFAIPTSDPGFAEGVFTIRLVSPLPAFTGGGITVDGTSQIAVTGPTNGTNPVIKVTAADDGVASGFVVQSDNNVIRSLIISGFDTAEGTGIVVSGDVSGNVVEGCLIGTTADGLAAEGNTIGVKVESGARNTTIGGTTAEARNVISGNGIGIAITGEATTGTRIVGNRIGSAVTGDPLGNRRGILIADSRNNLIGGTTPGEGNIIAHQESTGIEITGAAVNNSILGNSIFGNGGLGIDLGGDGPTPNDEGDADTGPNNLHNSPVITEVAVRGLRMTIAGTLDSAAGDVRVELFSDSRCDPSGFGEGLQFLGALTVTATGDPARPTLFTVELPPPSARFFVTATATDSAGNTSEFSACRLSNTAPIANAGPDQTVDEGVVVTLDGTASRDPDGDPITFRWRQVAGPSVTLSDPTSPRPTFTAPVVSPTVPPPVVLTFELVVSDGRLASDPDQVQITVNRRPIAHAGPDQTVDEGVVVTLDGTASRDPDGDPITFQWRQTAGPPVTLSDPTSPRPRFTAPSLLVSEPTSLRLTFSLVVNDRRLNSAPDTVDITVQNVVRMDDSGRSGNQLKINLATNAFEFRSARTGQLFIGTITTIVRGAGDGGGLRLIGSGTGGARLEVTIDTRRGVGLAVLVVGRDTFVIFSPDMRRE